MTGDYPLIIEDQMALYVDGEELQLCIPEEIDTRAPRPVEVILMAVHARVQADDEWLYDLYAWWRDNRPGDSPQH